jgi:DNA polymerase III gamma/tau subunit
MDRLKHIVQSEGISLSSDSILMSIMQASAGDLRRSINILQSAYTLYGSRLSQQHIVDIAGQVPVERVQRLLDACHSADMQSVQSVVDELVQEGYSAGQVVSQLTVMLPDPALRLPSSVKAGIASAMGVVDLRLTDGSEDSVQLMYLASQMVKAMTSAKMMGA